MGIVDPDKFGVARSRLFRLYCGRIDPLLIILDYCVGKDLVNLVVGGPLVPFAWPLLELLQTLEIVEQRSDHSLVEQVRLVKGLLAHEHWDAVVGSQEFLNFGALLIGLWVDARVPNPH